MKFRNGQIVKVAKDIDTGPYLKFPVGTQVTVVNSFYDEHSDMEFVEIELGFIKFTFQANELEECTLSEIAEGNHLKF